MDQSTNKGYRAWTNTTLGKKKTKYNSNRFFPLSQIVMKFKIVKKSSSQNLYHIQRTCTCNTGTGEKYGSAHLTENACGKESNATLRSKALSASCWLVRSDSQGFWFVARNAKDTATRKLACVSWKSPENFFSHPKSLPKISCKRFHVFLLNAPIFRARKWACDFNSDNSRVPSEDPENFSGDFSAGKISAFEHCLTKSAKCLQKSGRLHFLKNT